MKEQKTFKETSFNEKFCGHLEFRLCRIFENSHREDLRGFWCDGVSWHPIDDKQLNKKNVNDTRRITTKAWIGSTLTPVTGKF